MVFGVGFALGPLRVLLLEPRFGVPAAVLMEAPLLLAAIMLAGRWVGRTLCAGGSSLELLGVGVLAAGIVLIADVLVGVGLRGMTILAVFTARDLVSGSVYYALVAVTAIAPWMLGRSARS